MLVYTLYVARTRCRGVPQDRATTIYVHTLLDEAEGKVCVEQHDLLIKNLLDIRNLVELETLLY